MHNIDFIIIKEPMISNIEAIIYKTIRHSSCAKMFLLWCFMLDVKVKIERLWNGLRIVIKGDRRCPMATRHTSGSTECPEAISREKARRGKGAPLGFFFPSFLLSFSSFLLLSFSSFLFIFSFFLLVLSFSSFYFLFLIFFILLFVYCKLVASLIN